MKGLRKIVTECSDGGMVVASGIGGGFGDGRWGRRFVGEGW